MKAKQFWNNCFLPKACKRFFFSFFFSFLKVCCEPIRKSNHTLPLPTNFLLKSWFEGFSSHGRPPPPLHPGHVYIDCSPAKLCSYAIKPSDRSYELEWRKSSRESQLSFLFLFILSISHSTPDWCVPHSIQLLLKCVLCVCVCSHALWQTQCRDKLFFGVLCSEFFFTQAVAWNSLWIPFSLHSGLESAAEPTTVSAPCSCCENLLPLWSWCIL